MQNGQFPDHPEPHSGHSLRGARERRSEPLDTWKSSTNRHFGLLQIKKLCMGEGSMGTEVYRTENSMVNTGNYVSMYTEGTYRGVRSGLDQMGAQRVTNKVGDRMKAKLQHDFGSVAFHRSAADDENRSDLSIGLTPR